MLGIRKRIDNGMIIGVTLIALPFLPSLVQFKTAEAQGIEEIKTIEISSKYVGEHNELECSKNMRIIYTKQERTQNKDGKDKGPSKIRYSPPVDENGIPIPPPEGFSPPTDENGNPLPPPEAFNQPTDNSK